MKACILQHKMLASRETYQVVICPRSQQIKKKKRGKNWWFFTARIRLNTSFFYLLMFQFPPNMKWIKISDKLVELLFLSYIILI